MSTLLCSKLSNEQRELSQSLERQNSLRYKKNAISIDWPSYMRRCPHTLLINKQGQVAS